MEETPRYTFAKGCEMKEHSGKDTLDQMVDEIISELPLKERVSLSNMDKEDAEVLQGVFGCHKKKSEIYKGVKSMSKKIKIKNPEMSDTGKNWNVVTGCDKYSDGCLNCYAEDIVKWLEGMGQKVYQQRGFKLTMHDDRLEWPSKNLSKNPVKPAKSFVTDMGDLFHNEVTDEFIHKVFEVMLKVPKHRFYVLTKRAERLGTLGPQLPWKPWIWAGVTVESNEYVDRIEQLKNLAPDVNKFILMEPLLSSMPKLNLDGISWVVVGGETNKKMKFRPMKIEWVRDIRDQVKNAGLPFMFKHWPGRTHNSKVALLDGKIWDEYPASL